MKERMHPEITCPHCRTGFGGHKMLKDKMIHIDILWSRESGLQRDCQQESIKEHIVEIDDRGNPTFTNEFAAKLKELKEKFETNPDDIDKDTCDFDDYFISFVECMNYGYVDQDGEDYDRESMSREKLEEIYNNGTNLKDALRSFIVKVEE
jgi:hypothetical protein